MVTTASTRSLLSVTLVRYVMPVICRMAASVVFSLLPAQLELSESLGTDAWTVAAHVP